MKRLTWLTTVFCSVLMTASLVEAQSGDVCGPGNGDCYQSGGNGTPGCDDTDCCETVCAVDPFCCDTSWDGICAGEAADLCGVAGPCALAVSDAPPYLVDLSWNAPDDCAAPNGQAGPTVDYYRILRSRNGVLYAPYCETADDQTSVTCLMRAEYGPQGLTRCQGTWWFKVQAEYTGGGASGYSPAQDVVYTQLCVNCEKEAEALQGEDVACVGRISTTAAGYEVKWSPFGGDDVVGYNIYRTAPIQDMDRPVGYPVRVNSALLEAGQRSYVDSSADPSGSYYYQVTAVYSSGAQFFSDRLLASTATGVVAAPPQIEESSWGRVKKIYR